MWPSVVLIQYIHILSSSFLLINFATLITHTGPGSNLRWTITRSWPNVFKRVIKHLFYHKLTSIWIWRAFERAWVLQHSFKNLEKPLLLSHTSLEQAYLLKWPLLWATSKRGKPPLHQHTIPISMLFFYADAIPYCSPSLDFMPLSWGQPEGPKWRSPCLLGDKR